MIRIDKKIDTTRIASWLDRYVKPQLVEDVSSYAPHRERVWLRWEPDLRPDHSGEVYEALAVKDSIWEALQQEVDFPFAFALATYSGDGDIGYGIAPHMDAGYANFEAVSLNVVGQCEFNYWMAYPEYTYTPNRVNYQVDRRTKVVTLNNQPVEPTHRAVLEPGAVTRFNCKSPHSASPGPARWCLNFWTPKQEPVVVERPIFNSKLSFWSKENPKLSNFWMCEFCDTHGRVWPSVEHAYQAAKTRDPAEQEIVRAAQSAQQAKALGKTLTLRPDWSERKASVMLTICRWKFLQVEDCKQFLLSTNDRELVHYAPWDPYWGSGRNGGNNMLGRILMQIRTELKGK